MKIEKVNINDLISPNYNPRDITPEEMEKLKTSITEFGYVDPIIVNDVNMHIVGGNQRYFALKELEYTEVDVVYVHEEDINREKALNIALNKISGEFDNEKLTAIFNDFKLEGFEGLELTGFDEIEIEILTDDIDFDDFFDYEDDDEELPEDMVDVEGDVKVNYEILITVEDKETANKIMEKLGTNKRMTKTSCVLNLDDINGFI